jgi:hypothetical protein
MKSMRTTNQIQSRVTDSQKQSHTQGFVYAVVVLKVLDLAPKMRVNIVLLIADIARVYDSRQKPHFLAG